MYNSSSQIIFHFIWAQNLQGTLQQQSIRKLEYSMGLHICVASFLSQLPQYQFSCGKTGYPCYHSPMRYGPGEYSQYFWSALLNYMWKLGIHAKNRFFWPVLDHVCANKFVQGKWHRIPPLYQPSIFMLFLHFMPKNQTFELSRNVIFKFWWHLHFAHIE